MSQESKKQVPGSFFAIRYKISVNMIKKSLTKLQAARRFGSLDFYKMRKIYLQSVGSRVIISSN